ncbi:MAG: histidine kinase, partial [Betaproteobacteria bacterium]
MDTDQRSPGTANAAARGNNGPRMARSANQGTLREVWDGIVVVWWRFFDWLAVVSWKKLLLVSFLGLILAAMLSSVGSVGHRVGEAPNWFFLLIVASFIIKVVAGGKRRAEVTASEATKQAETEQLERTVLEARMEALQAQIEPHFLFNTLASIDQLIQTDPPRASKMQQSLIRYLRSAM